MKYTGLQCPTCRGYAIGAERSPDGNIFCVSGHKWKREDSLNWMKFGQTKTTPLHPITDDELTANNTGEVITFEPCGNYWKERCLLAEEFIYEWGERTPCIFRGTLESYAKWIGKVNDMELPERVTIYDEKIIPPLPCEELK